MTALSRRVLMSCAALVLSTGGVFVTTTPAAAAAPTGFHQPTAFEQPTGFTQPSGATVWATDREVSIVWTANSGPTAGAIELLYGDANSLQLVGTIATVDLSKAGNCRWLLSGAYGLPSGSEYSIRAGEGNYTPQFTINNPARPFNTAPGAPFTTSKGCIKAPPAAPTAP